MPSVKIGLLLSALALSVIGDAQAQSITIDFEELAQAGDGSIAVANAYERDGFVISVNIDPIFDSDAFSAWRTGSDSFNGSTALFNTYALDLVTGTTTTLTRADGGNFAIESIDLGQMFNASGSDTPVQFIGTKSDGSTASASFTLPSVLAPATYTFDATFMGLVSLRWEQLPQFHQFDNLVLVSAPVPEPASAWLVALGCCVLLAARWRRRQRATDSRASLIPIPASTRTPRPRTAHSEYRR